MSSEKLVRDIFALADIRIGGGRPWDIRVHNDGFYDRVLSQGNLGLGEAYMDNWWDCDDLDEFFFRVLRAELPKKIRPSFSLIWHAIRSTLFNAQTRSGSRKVAVEHYDLGNDLYEAFLDPYLQYTCGYFKDTEDLNVAQEQKLDLLCRKLQLQPGDRVLDIGCGWGGFAKYAASKYGCHVTGLTISKEQAAYARAYCQGLPVEIVEKDYRDADGTYDKVVIVGMIEHVGYKNYRKIMKVVSRVLAEDGVFVLHTIGSKQAHRAPDRWITKYIFANSHLPAAAQLAKAYEGLFIMEDWQNFGAYYHKTLRAWYEKFHEAWPKLREKYGDRFARMWDYYLLSCAGAFRARDIQLWQIVMTKRGMLGGYMAPR